ncbi:MAG: hypothetical protein Tsb0021_02160 [Chlamydiales bacterium]
MQQCKICNIHFQKHYSEKADNHNSNENPVRRVSLVAFKNLYWAEKNNIEHLLCPSQEGGPHNDPQKLKAVCGEVIIPLPETLREKIYSFGFWLMQAMKDYNGFLLKLKYTEVFD